MDFDIPPRSAELIPKVREFVRTEIQPLEPELLAKGFRALEPKLEAVRKKVKANGWFAPHLSREHGGTLALSLLEFAFLSEELGRTPTGHYCFNCQAPDIGNMEILAKFGTPEQKHRFFEPLARGEIRSCFSMTEPNRPGSNPVWLATTATRDGDHYVINGHKWFTSSADGASFAIVMVVTDPNHEDDYHRASQIIVPTDTPGFKRVRNISVMGEAGEGYPTHSEILYESVRVPRTNLLGEEGAGFAIAQERLGPGRIHHCMRWLGICERAFELMCTRAASWNLGPDKQLGTRQTVQNWVADSRAEINAARLMVLQAAWKIDREGSHAARNEVSLIKFFVANVLQNVLDRALQSHGALGMTDDTPLAYWYRHERAARIYDGPDEVHRSSVAKRILASYGLKR